MKKILLSAAILACGGMARAVPHSLTPAITWEVVDTTLYIAGTGDMPDFGGIPTPWGADDVVGQVRAIVVGEGITSVGECAFRNPYADNSEQYTLSAGALQKGNRKKQQYFGYFNNVRRVHLPSTLVRIDANAFQNLLITSIDIPASVTHIGALAFNLCDLRYVKLPAGLENLGYSAFESCVNLRCVDFSGARIRVLKGAFFCCERLDQVLNSENITEVHPLGIDASPLAAHGNILAYLRLPNLLRYRVQNFTPWGEYIDKFMPDPPEFNSAEKKAANIAIRQWKRDHPGESRLALREFTDSLWTEMAELSEADNSDWSRNHSTISDKYDSELQLLYRNYFSTLANGKTEQFIRDEFALGQYDSQAGCFIISSTHHGRLRMTVPADKAPEVQAQWTEMAKSVTPRYVRRGDDMALRNAVFTDHEGNRFAAAPIAD